MKVTIREATREDRAAWAALRSELWPECPPERHALEVEQLLMSKGVVALAIGEGTVVGFAEVSIRVDHVEGTEASPVPYLEGWYVRREYRGKGIGRGLLEWIERWSWEQGFRELASDAEMENSASIQLHGQLGFREVGRTVHFVKSLDHTTFSRVSTQVGPPRS